MKTKETLALERAIMEYTRKTGVFGCLEVTIGFFGRQRVDYMTYDTKGDFRCYEIKVSVADFHSDAELSFVGNYNYLLTTRKVYDKVKDEIERSPKFRGVGVIVGDDTRYGFKLSVEKAPRRKDISNDFYQYRRSVDGRSTVIRVSMTEVLKDSMIRSLFRDAEKLYVQSKVLDTVLKGKKRAEKKLKELEKKVEKKASKKQTKAPKEDNGKPVRMPSEYEKVFGLNPHAFEEEFDLFIS